MRWLMTAVLATGLCMYSGVSQAGAAPSADPACVAACERAESDCGAATRRARGECARLAASGGRDPLAAGAQRGAPFCDFFQTDACLHARDAGACRRRMRSHYLVCIDPHAKAGVAQYLECGAAERSALALCRDELRACVADCG